MKISLYLTLQLTSCIAMSSCCMIELSISPEILKNVETGAELVETKPMGNLRIDS